MALYGSSLYGIPLYGAFNSGTISSITYDANFEARQNDYGIIKLTWDNVTIPSSDAALTNWKVIRTVGGPPDYPNTFIPPVIYGTTSDSYSLDYVISGNTYSNGYTFFENYFPSGTEVTYSLWVFNQSRWIFAGSSDCIIVHTTDTTDRLMKLLPPVWTNARGGIGDATGLPERFDTSTTETYKINSITPNSPNYGNVTYNVSSSMPIRYDSQYATISGVSIDGYNGQTTIIYISDTSFYTVNSTTNLTGLDLSNAVVSISEENDLWKFVSSFGFYYDKLNTEISLLNTISDYRKYPYTLLPASISALGFEYNQTLGTGYLRSMYKAGHLINSLRGTQLGVLMYAESVLSARAQFYAPTNLFLDYNDSSFEESTGNWAITGTNTFSAKKYSNIAAELGSGYSLVVAPLRNNLMLGKTLRTQGYGLITSTGTSDIILTSYSAPAYTISKVTPNSPSTGYVTFSTSTPTNYRDQDHVYVSGVTPSGYNGNYDINLIDSSTFSVPNTTTGSATLGSTSLTGFSTSIPTITRTIQVKQGKSYIFTGYIQRLTANTNAGATVSAQIIWFDDLGFPIATNTGYGSTVVPGTSWTLFTSSLSGTNYIAPSNAAYAAVNIKISGQATGDKYIIDMFSFTELTDSLLKSIENLPVETLYEDAKTIHLELQGFRTNLITNSNFSDGVGSWNAINGTLIQDFTSGYYGTTSAKFTPTSSGSAVVSTWIDVLPNRDYTFSVYVKGSIANLSAKVGIEFSLPASGNDQITLTSDGSNAYYGQSTNKVYSSTVTIDNSTYTRISVTAQSPDYLGNVGFSKALVSIEPVTYSGGYFNIDCAMLEENSKALPFFQGDGGPLPTNIYTDIHTPQSDCVWEVRPRANFIYNPNFETDTTYYTSAVSSGATATPTVVTTDTASSLTYTPKYGTKFAKIAASNTATYSALGTSFRYPYLTKNSNNLPNSPSGGTSITSSAYVASAVAGTFTIYSQDLTSGTSASNTFTIPGGDTNWYRIHVTNTVGTPVDSAPGMFVRVSFAPTTVGAHAWYLDSVQTEYGYEPTSFIDPSDTNTSTITNTSEVSLGTSTVTSTITSATLSGGYLFYTTSTPHKIMPGMSIAIAGVGTGYNGTKTVTADVLSTNLSTAYTFCVGTSATAPTITGSPTVAFTNSTTNKNMYGTATPMSGLGRSYYWPSGYGAKLSRLINTMPNYIPAGSSYRFQIGLQSNPSKEIISSLVNSSSFENNLYGWSPTSTTTSLTRKQGRGSLYSERGALSTSWAIVKNTASSEATFGVSQTNIMCNPSTDYILFAAFAFPNTSDLGTVTMTINWYDSQGGDAYNYNSSGNKISGSNTLSITSGAFTTTNRWYGFGNNSGDTTIITSPPSAYSAKLTITSDPSGTRTGTNYFYLDSVIFGEV